MSHEELKPCNCREKGVHNAHCCSQCGCKYGDPYCPVDDGIVCDECKEESASITREQVNEWCKEQGMAIVPVELTDDILLSKHWPQTYDDCWEEELDLYRKIIKAAQGCS